MWVVRLAHPAVNMFRLIAEHTRESAEQKAADQLKAWSAEYRHAEHWLDAKKRKQLLSRDQRNRRLAEYLTAQIQEDLQLLKSLLRTGPLLTYTVTWGPRDLSPFPIPAPVEPKTEDPPAEPLHEAHSFRPGLLSRLIPPLRQWRETEAEDRFRLAHAVWEQSKSDIELRSQKTIDKFRHQVAEWERAKEEWLGQQARRNAIIDEQEQAYYSIDPKTVAAYCRMVLNASPYPCIAASVPQIATHEVFSSSATASEHPDTFPRDFELDYSDETRTLVVEYELPPVDAMPSAKAYKYVASKDKAIPSPMAQSSADGIYELVLYQVALRTIYELFRWDEATALDSVGFNGWVNALDNATGRRGRTCILTVQAGKREFREINLTAVDPKACFRKLKGISGAKLAGMSPVRPLLQMNRDDKRFVSARPVIDALDTSMNLAAMDWEDFEQLIRDVFEREFSNHGGEVKITRASRDHGVDAVAFDPDPIRGGKIVIQAKRYTNPVSVSAVRDLYGTILNEGANKGILVTTADYGPDAYEFAKGKPITLLNGSELLYLLQKHGHRARIDLAEARKIAAEEGRDGSG